MKLIHITDTHLVEPGGILYDLDPRQRLDACIADINEQHGDAELCVITGDLTHWGEAAAYQNLKESLAALTVPVVPILGNHDDRPTFREYFPDAPVDADGFIQGVQDVSAGRFLYLDTNLEGTHAGWYCDKRFAWLEEQLCAADGATPLYLFMHHPPFDIGMPSLDAIGIAQADAFAALIEPHRIKIRHLFFGHVHRPVSGSWLGIPVSTLRATNHQCWLDFRDVENPLGSHEPPAYAVVLIDDRAVVVHSHDYLDRSPKFDMGAQTEAERDMSTRLVS